MKTYKSLKELDKHLKILRLQADIHKQKTEIDAKFIKHSLKPTNLLAEVFAVLGQKQIYSLAVKLLLKKFKVK